MTVFTDAQKRQLAMLVGANRVIWMDRYPSAEAEEKAWQIVTDNMKATIPFATVELMKKEWSTLRLQYYTMLVNSTMYEDTGSVYQHRFLDKMKFLGDKLPYSYRIEVIDTEPITAFTRSVTLPPSTKTIEAVKRKYGVLFSQMEAQAVREEIARLDVENTLSEILGMGASPTKRQRIADNSTTSLNYKINSDVLARFYQKKHSIPAKQKLFKEYKHESSKSEVEPFDLEAAIRKATVTNSSKNKEECLFVGRITQPDELREAAIRAKVSNEDGFNLDEALANVLSDKKKVLVECKASPSTSSSGIFDLDAALKEASWKWSIPESSSKQSEQLVSKKRNESMVSKIFTALKLTEASPSDIFDLNGAIEEARRKLTTLQEAHSSGKQTSGSSTYDISPFRMITSAEVKLLSGVSGSGIFDLDEAICNASKKQNETQKDNRLTRTIDNEVLVLDLESDPLDTDSILYNSFSPGSKAESEYFTDVTQSHISEIGDKESDTSSVDLSMVSCSTSVYKEQMEALVKE